MLGYTLRKNISFYLLKHPSYVRFDFKPCHKRCYSSITAIVLFHQCPICQADFAICYPRQQIDASLFMLNELGLPEHEASLQ
ncbi:hypothetical protein N7460_004148 [Penicillium canescens]|uniref:Uncharacterized protein n=1 Tax=Penicillium canescens TaxID=5083 RepID=A0AAD6IHC3_PENCN|nr:hypothetical protein N7460_004148 [Penicillium canescens]